MQEKRKQIYILMSSCGIQLVEEVTNKKVVGASSEETVFLRKQMERSLKVMGLSQNTIQNHLYFQIGFYIILKHFIREFLT